MYDDINGFYYTYNQKISLTPSECHILDKLITKGIIADNNFNFTQSHIRTLVCRINKKLKGELKIKRKNAIGYYIEYIGRRKTDEIKRSRRVYKRKLYKLPKTM
jgi:hypothetical protein